MLLNRTELRWQQQQRCVNSPMDTTTIPAALIHWLAYIVDTMNIKRKEKKKKKTEEEILLLLLNLLLSLLLCYTCCCCMHENNNNYYYSSVEDASAIHPLHSTISIVYRIVEWIFAKSACVSAFAKVKWRGHHHYRGRWRWRLEKKLCLRAKWDKILKYLKYFTVNVTDNRTSAVI